MSKVRRMERGRQGPALLASLVSVLAVLACLPAGGARPAPGTYSVTDLGHLPGCDVTFAQALNDRGQVVGYSYRYVPPGHLGSTLAHAFLWENGRMRRLPTLGGEFGHALDINERGDIAGDADTPDLTLPVLWPAAARRVAVPLARRAGRADAVNDRGEAAGVAEGRLVLWQRAGRREWRPPGGAGVGVTSLNSRSEVAAFTFEQGLYGSAVGQRGLIWRSGQGEVLRTLGGKHGLCAVLTDEGWGAGWSETLRGERRACVWKRGIPAPLPTPGADRSEAAAANRHGVIVGEATLQGRSRAYLWARGAATDLNTRLSPRRGWVLHRAVGINDRGQVLGHGLRRGEQRSFLLTPRRAGR